MNAERDGRVGNDALELLQKRPLRGRSLTGILAGHDEIG
jgi:hypothetical protein